jgi:tRNA G18 (ribose-2'-O)-methylase SpoU
VLQRHGTKAPHSQDALQWLTQSCGGRLGGGSEPDARDCRGFALTRPAILVVGSEARGLRPVVRRACQARALFRLGVCWQEGVASHGAPCAAA